MTVVLVDPRRPTLIPVEAIELLGGEVAYTEEIPIKVPWSLPSAKLVSDTGQASPAAVLLSSDRNHPAVAARIALGEKVISAPEAQTGERLIDAVAIMDRLRTAGPWESTQTHESLHRYLVEETYELFDAVRGGDADELRDELGDLLLQVLFHARIAQDADHPFDIDDVADALVRKLGNRVPAVLAGESISLEDQLAQWEERKAQEKLEKSSRDSAMDDLPTAQPSLALAQKVISRAQQAGLPADLIPAGILAVELSPNGDAESALRAQVLEFMDNIRAAEEAVAAQRLETGATGQVGAQEWRDAWPSETPDELTDGELRESDPS